MDVLEEMERDEIIKIKKWERTLFSISKWVERKLKGLNKPLPKSYYIPEKKFAPIYDSGSSLGRELLDETVELLLKSDNELKKYIDKGTSEIHWENKKISHFELIRNLLDSSHKEKVKNIIERVIRKYEDAKIEDIIAKVDQKTPESLARYKIPTHRKRLILKIITLRFEMLRALLNEGIR